MNEYKKYKDKMAANNTWSSYGETPKQNRNSICDFQEGFNAGFQYAIKLLNEDGDHGAISARGLEKHRGRE